MNEHNLSVSASTTIIATATASGRAGVGVIRLSGPQALSIALTIANKKSLTPRMATMSAYTQADGSLIDEGLSLYFPAPHSFTGEDVVELQTHGSPLVLDTLIQRALDLGAELAKPGEFSERAFLNNKMDLTQAEAIADLIDANTQAAAKAAVQSLQGEFSRVITTLNHEITQLRMYVEAAIDFPDEEDVDFIAEGDVINKIQHIKNRINEIEQSAQQGQLLRDGMTIVLAGLPNAGKSSLLNRLAGQERAIVTDIEGTTRDVLREMIAIDGMPLTIIDTAGLRESDDPVETEGIKRARAAIDTADHILYLVDAQQGWRAQDALQIKQLGAASSRTILWNKSDLLISSSAAPSLATGEDQIAQYQLSISATSGLGIEHLREHLKNIIGYQATEGGQYLARRRHLQAIVVAKSHIEAAREVLLSANAGELAAEELRLAHRALGEITGEFTADDLLGVIFSQFCIGK